MPWLIFILYLIFFSWLITRVGFIRRAGLSNSLLIALFAIKIFAGIIYFKFHLLPEYKYRSDTWKFHESSLRETKILKQDPAGFISDIFYSDYNTAGNLFSAQNSYWNDVKDLVMIKLMAVFNLFTFDNYYANIIFFNFFFFLGLIAFYRVMKTLYPDKKILLVAAIFFVPSFLFWCSGIHKDGLIFSCIGLILFSFHSILDKKKWLPAIVTISLCMVVIFLLRNYLALVLMMSLFIGWLFHAYPSRRWITLIFLVVAMTGFLFTAKYIHPSLDLPAYVVSKQQQFKALEGRSVIQQEDLQPTLGSFIQNLPSAIDMGFFRPHPGEKGMISLAASIEMIFFWLIIILCFIYRRKDFPMPPVAWVCVIFSLTVLLIIGYTVPFSGAVVRYRSLVLPLLLTISIGWARPSSNIIKKYI